MSRARTRELTPKVLICVALLATAVSNTVAFERPLDHIGASLWIENPHRTFGAPRPVLPGRVVLMDEADDPALHAALAAEMRRIQVDLFDKQGWRNPIAEGEILRVYVSRRQSDGLRRISARRSGHGLLFSPAILIDGSGLESDEIARAAARVLARATLAGYAAPDHSFLTDSVAELLAVPRESEKEREAARSAAAAPEIAISWNALTLGRNYVEEFARETGAGTLRGVFEKSSETGEELLSVFLRVYSETTGRDERALLLRSAARLYAGLETEPGPSRIGLLDLQSGAFDAAAPGPFMLRHRTYLPTETASALRVPWPEGGGAAAAVVRYRDAALPPDVVFLAPGAPATVPLSGVSRVDFLVAGSRDETGAISAPAFFETLSDFPFTGLAPQAAATRDGPSLTWTTASHRELYGWAVFREEVLPDGRIARTGPEIVPASFGAEESFRYAYLDTGAAPGVYYRYTVWAITGDGLLARAFSATFRTPEYIPAGDAPVPSTP